MAGSKPLRGAASLFAAALGLLAACTTPDGVRFGRPSHCPEPIVEILTVRPSELGPWSETDTLECALSWLQDTDDPTLRRSALGSRLSLHLAERTPEADRRENLAAEGVRFAEAAIALGADGDGAVHYYLAANLGLVIRDHVTLAMENLPRLQGAMQRAVDLSPDIDDGGPLRVLGILYLKAPPWPTGFGDGEKALELLQAVVEKHPRHPLNHLFYAEVLWEADESSPIARIETELATGMRCLSEGNWGYNRAPWKKEFDRFLDDIGGSAR
ncbi:MAG: sterol transporter outer membrane protein BstC [Gammaproteobacteria bacterium]